MRKIISSTLPEPAHEPATLRGLLDQALETPQLLPVRMFWDNFNALRPWWPVLVPLLLWVGWRTYRRERQRFTQRASTVP